MLVFTEWHTNSFGVSFRVKKMLYSEKTPYQEVKVIETEDFGKVLIINNEVQVAEKDENIYHEMLVHPLMFSHPSPENVLIIGGGDGGTLREVLKHGVKKVTLVEIDKRIIEICKKFFPSLAKGFEDERVKVVNQDGYDFIFNSKEKYDIAILDLTDPKGIAKKLASEKFYSKVSETLTNEGMVSAQVPNVLLHKKEALLVYSSIASAFPISRLYSAPIPSLSGMWNFGLGSKKLSPEEIRKRDNKVKTSFYSKEFHKAIFEYGKIFERILNIK
ncbi:MAG: spermidine synthase [Candidatus Hydrothermarchaeota archaeon]|nr:MAG: spermidine synthase [Candidatus Hydrothermarchaeota archaeon]